MPRLPAKSIVAMGKRARLIVAIDGPAGAGKSTVARSVADRIGYVLVDTGAMYRCVALASTRAGLKPHEPLSAEEEERIGVIAEQLAERRSIVLEPSGGVLLDS